MSGFDAASADDSNIHSALLRIPSVFGRLVYMATMADPRDMDETASNRHRQAVRTEHMAVFEAWLWASLEQKLEDLKMYASSERLPPYELVWQWLQPSWFERLVPLDVSRAKRELFEADLESLLPILGQG